MILIDRKISTFSFLNAITSGILCNKKNWVKEFINKFHQYILPNNQKEIMTMAKAYLAFHEHQYNQVTDLLLDFKPTITELNIQARTLTTRAYFEILATDDTYYELFLSNLDSFSKYLYRTDRASQSRTKATQNFIYFLKQLGKLLGEKKINNDSLNSLMIEIENTKPLASQSWFLNRIEKLKSPQ